MFADGDDGNGGRGAGDGYGDGGGSCAGSDGVVVVAAGDGGESAGWNVGVVVGVGVCGVVTTAVDDAGVWGCEGVIMVL